MAIVQVGRVPRVEAWYTTFAMSDAFPSKTEARQAVWDLLQDRGEAAFPFPPHGRIPNFKGASLAAERLFTLPLWRGVRCIKVNPDAPQRFVRLGALRRGITIYVPTPRLRGGFKCLDPAGIPEDRIREAASLSKAERWAQSVELDSLPRLDAIVCGSVAVTRDGRRCGKGEGYSDLEFAILRELGHPPVPVATTVHELQIVCGFPRERNDLPLSVIVTPEATITVQSPPAAPEGIDWRLLSDEQLEAMPVLRELRRRGEPE